MGQGIPTLTMSVTFVVVRDPTRQRRILHHFVALMTDVYPPFHLDQGPAEPTGGPRPLPPPAPSQATSELDLAHHSLRGRNLLQMTRLGIRNMASK